MSELSPPETRHTEVQVEDLHVRNYDDDEHVLWVRAVPEDGTIVFEQSFRLAGQGSASELDALPPGTYDVEVELDGLRRWATRCDLADGPASQLLIETGNGTVSITTPDRRIDAQHGG